MKDSAPCLPRNRRYTRARGCSGRRRNRQPPGQVEWKVRQTQYLHISYYCITERACACLLYLERSEDHRRLGALEACRKLGCCDRSRLEDCHRGLGSDRRLGGCGRVRDAVNSGSGGGLYAAEGLGVERCRMSGRRPRCQHHIRRHRRHFGRHCDLGDQAKCLRAKSFGLIVLDEESAVGLDRVNGAGTPIDRDALGARVGARVSKRAWLGDRLGL